MRTALTPVAREGSLAQYRYDARDQRVPDVGFRFLDAVEAAIARVRDMPAIGGPQYFDGAALVGMRAWPVPGFEDIRLYYLETADVPLIVGVLQDKRDLRRTCRVSLHAREHGPPCPVAFAGWRKAIGLTELADFRGVAGALRVD